MYIALALFAVTYVLMLVFSKYRPYIALASALVFIATGMLPLKSVLGTIDFNVLLMIAGTMGIVALFIESKMPELLADLIMEKVPNVQLAAVAMALFASMTECKNFLVEGMAPDIHDVTIKDVFADTNYSLVALRNTDGAKMYRIFIENIRDSGGIYGPRNVVRIGENLYYKERTSIIGETYDIHVCGVYSLNRCTVIIGGALSNSHISDIYAGGTSMSAISTFAIHRFHEQKKLYAWGGATMENVVIDNVHYHGTAEHLNEEWMNKPGTDFPGCALDFRCMREEDYFENVIFRDIFARQGSEIYIACDKVTPNII